MEEIAENNSENETVKLWKENFLKTGRTIGEEISETQAAISNERIWQKAASNPEEEQLHSRNITDLTEYLDWLNEVNLEIR